MQCEQTAPHTSTGPEDSICKCSEVSVHNDHQFSFTWDEYLISRVRVEVTLPNLKSLTAVGQHIVIFLGLEEPMTMAGHATFKL